MKRRRPLCPPLFWNGRLGLILLAMLITLSLIFSMDMLLVQSDAFNEPYVSYLSGKRCNASAMDVEMPLPHFYLQIKGPFFNGRVLFSPLLICVPVAMICAAAVLVLVLLIVLSDQPEVPNLETPKDIEDPDPIEVIEEPTQEDNQTPLYKKWWFWCVILAVKLPLVRLFLSSFSRKNNQETTEKTEADKKGPFNPIKEGKKVIQSLIDDIKDVHAAVVLSISSNRGEPFLGFPGTKNLCCSGSG
jgi:hypothetical protein